MRMLEAAEIALRMRRIIEDSEPGAIFSTEALIKQIPVSADELLPVGDLLSVHHTLMQCLETEPAITVDFQPGGALMPYKARFTCRNGKSFA